MHRLAALATLGAKTVIALVMPEPEIAFRILALNTEKAHNLKDKALEVIRMARAIAADGRRAARPTSRSSSSSRRSSRSASATRRTRGSPAARTTRSSRSTESFSTEPMAKSLAMREAHADKLLELDERGRPRRSRKLKEAGFTSGYLKPIVVARVNPLRFVKPGKDDARPTSTRRSTR